MVLAKIDKSHMVVFCKFTPPVGRSTCLSMEDTTDTANTVYTIDITNTTNTTDYNNWVLLDNTYNNWVLPNNTLS